LTDVVPSSRPNLSIVDARKLMAAYGLTDTVLLIGIRGYCDKPGKNTRGAFDDAIALLSPRTFKTFNANTDPSAFGGRLAVLQPGVWTFKKGIHHPGTPNAYPCLVQADAVTVLRDNGIRETGEFYIHIHHGGFNTTTSEGCQTIYRGQWDEFHALYEAEMDFYGLETIDYLLAENDA
jgi:lysozyme